MDSSLQVYLEEINSTELLTAEEEKELARRIVENGDLVARDRMIRANLRLVVNIAKKYSKRGMALADLIEEKLEVQLKSEHFELSVNGTHIPMNPFVRDIMARTVVAMVSSLKGVKDVKSLRIFMRRGS